MIFDKNTQRSTFKLGAGEQESYISVPSQFYAGIEARVEWIPGEGIQSDMLFRVVDSKGREYVSQQLKLKDGLFTARFIPRGASGTQKMFFKRLDTQIENVHPFTLEAKTFVATDDHLFDEMLHSCEDQPPRYWETEYWELQGLKFYATVPWVRDNAHILKATRYWENAFQLQAWIDFFLRQQREDGMIYEKLGYWPENGVICYNRPECYKCVGPNGERGDGRAFVIERLELEADVEYLLVQAAYQAWQATGDNQWMKSVLPGLDKAMTYIRTDEKRWDKKENLAMRVNTADTWDYAYGPAGRAHRKINDWRNPEPNVTPTYMCIFHGDNTGFYQAARELAEMYRVCGNEERAAYWDQEAEGVRKRLMKLAWNGEYFAHMIHIGPTLEEVPEEAKDDWAGDWTRLSTSDAYVLNRDFLTQEEAEKVLTAYMRFRDNPPNVMEPGLDPQQKIFAEWVTMYPPYTGGHSFSYPGRDVNGSIASFAGGELARGAFRYGFEAYGWDILRRFRDLFKRDGEIWFLYSQDSRPHWWRGGGRVGPDPWGTSAVYVAALEGLAGVQNLGDQFMQVRLQPCWSASEIKEAYVSASFGPSDRYIAYQYKEEADRIICDVTGSSCRVELSVLLPEGKSVKKVIRSGEALPYTLRSVRNSCYAEVILDRENDLDIEQIVILLQ